MVVVDLASTIPSFGPLSKNSLMETEASAVGGHRME